MVLSFTSNRLSHYKLISSPCRFWCFDSSSSTCQRTLIPIGQNRNPFHPFQVQPQEQHQKHADHDIMMSWSQLRYHPNRITSSRNNNNNVHGLSYYYNMNQRRFLYLSSSSSSSIKYIHNASATQTDREDTDETTAGTRIRDDKNTQEEGGPSAFDYTPATVISNIVKASQWREGLTWDPQACTKAFNEYEEHLKYISSRLQQKQQQEQQTTNTSISFTDIAKKVHSDPKTFSSTQELVSPQIAEKAFKTILKMNIHTSVLSKRVRELERLIGSIRLTPITDSLSFRLLEANAKAGNVGRTMAILHLRKVKGYEPSITEFEYAIRSITSAGLYLRCNRNVFIMESDQPGIDNPTRWLDAILINMSSRNFPLTTALANRMLDCYAQTGRSGKAIHYFYKVSNHKGWNRQQEENSFNFEQSESKDDETLEDNLTANTLQQSLSTLNHNHHILQQDPKDNDDKSSSYHNNLETSMIQRRKAKVRMKFHASPPYYKQISEVKHRGGKVYMRNNKSIEDRNTSDLMSKLEIEKDRHWSIPLTAAFAFADSLTFGACGHKAIQLDLTSWNTLIKVCCYRGSLWRAIEILNETMPRNGISPDTISYNTILAGLARVGDTMFMRELLTTMTNKEITLDKYTIQALVDGYLNTGDISGAITILQDVFNQHQVLPPYTTHLKIIEFSLGYDLVFEAKRHVYFLQQLWQWKPSDHHSAEFCKIMLLTQSNPKLSKAAIQRLFKYFGEFLHDDELLM